MKALIRCKAHPMSPRPSFDICSLNTNGEVSAELGDWRMYSFLGPVRATTILSNLQASLRLPFIRLTS